MKRLFGLLLVGLISLNLSAKDTDEGYVIDSFWANWYLEARVDMSLQNPYGQDFLGGFYHQRHMKNPTKDHLGITLKD